MTPWSLKTTKDYDNSYSSYHKSGPTAVTSLYRGGGTSCDIVTRTDGQEVLCRSQKLALRWAAVAGSNAVLMSVRHVSAD